jgi:malate dehydrogenase (oxaloacetate-decarboxylating)
MPNASYSVTLRVRLDPDDAQAIGAMTTAVGEAGGIVTGMDFVESGADGQVVDLTVNASDAAHANLLRDAINEVRGAHVHKVSDRTFLMHLKGKLEVRSRVPLKTRDDLSMAYTPGVARVCTAIAENPGDAYSLTIKGNTVAIVTDGSAVLGLGNIGPLAAMPVMEGKAALFKRFAGIDAWPICLDTQDPDEIVAIVKAIAPGFGGINLEDIAAPGAFEVEARLREALDIPVFHDDQHGTAVVVLAALHNALRVVDKRMEEIVVTMAGAGAAGSAIARLLLAEGVADVRLADREGLIGAERVPTEDNMRWLIANTNKAGRTGSIADGLDGADVFIGVSAPNVIEASDILRMNERAIVFALANPDPEVDPHEARKHAAVVATGRSDLPNQINNVLAFPGIFRGALDARATSITEEMKVAAARAIADVIGPDEVHASYVIPSVFNPAVASAVAEAVKAVAVSGT